MFLLVRISWYRLKYHLLLQLSICHIKSLHLQNINQDMGNKKYKTIHVPKVFTLQLDNTVCEQI